MEPEMSFSASALNHRVKHSVRTFARNCCLAMGVRVGQIETLNGDSVRDTAPQVPPPPSFMQLPIDPEAAIVLAYWSRESDLLEALQSWLVAHRRLIARRRIEHLASLVGIDEPDLGRATHSRGVQLSVNRTPNVWLRARLAFGIGPRAALVAAVCEWPTSAHSLHQIADESQFTIRALRESAQDLSAVDLIRYRREAGGSAVEFVSALDNVRSPGLRQMGTGHRPVPAPGPALHGRRWTKLLRLIAVAEEVTRSAGYGNEDGNEDGNGDGNGEGNGDGNGDSDEGGDLVTRGRGLGRDGDAWGRIRDAARQANFLSLDLAPPRSEFDEFPMLRRPIDVLCRLLTDLEGW
jgi:hypothetical protein